MEETMFLDPYALRRKQKRLLKRLEKRIHFYERLIVTLIIVVIALILCMGFLIVWAHTYLEIKMNELMEMKQEAVVEYSSPAITEQSTTSEQREIYVQSLVYAEPIETPSPTPIPAPTPMPIIASGRDTSKDRVTCDEETYDLFCKIVEAEVTGDHWTYQGNKVSADDMLASKIRVAQVFINRVLADTYFGEDLYDVLTKRGASSTLLDGRAWQVTVTDLTKQAVDTALSSDTLDTTQGALYFKSGSTTCEYGDYLFTDAVGHSFFK